jgi:uncharacterized repeat protein (TIGR03803 family)
MKKTQFVWAVAFLLVLAPYLQAQFNTLHPFSGAPADGKWPQGSLVLKGSTLYGLTDQGGALDVGTIFKINVNGAGYALLHTFTGSTSDGANPNFASLVLSGSTLYGMTCAGGTKGGGTIFKINVNGTGFKVLHSFDGGPYGSLTLRGTTLYGVTQYGGSANWGTIFKINVNGTGFKVLHSFGVGADGYGPCGVLKYTGTKFYGMTMRGGAAGQGIIYKINPDGTGYAPLHSFIGGALDGARPYYNNSFVAIGSVLYGMTLEGGANDRGTIFKINANGTGFALLHSFGGGAADGRYPYGALTLVGEALYGMTRYDGVGHDGTIFSINTDGLGFGLVLTFGPGSNPYGTLIRKVSTTYGDMLYGVASEGGDYNYGIIFSYKL